MKISGRIVRPGAVVPGHVEIDGPTIIDVVADNRAGDDIVVPGFVDLHCHGGGGHTFTTGDAPSEERITDARPKPMPANATAPSTRARTSAAQFSGSSASYSSRPITISTAVCTAKTSSVETTNAPR